MISYIQNILEYDIENVLKERQHQKCIEQDAFKRICNSNGILTMR